MSIQDKNTNELKDLLQRKLAAAEPTDDGWNMPSNRVWEGVSEELKDDRKVSKGRDRHYLLMAVIVGLLSMLLFRECSNYSEINELESEMHLLRNSFEQLQEDCEQKQTGFIHKKTDEQMGGLEAPIPPETRTNTTSVLSKKDLPFNNNQLSSDITTGTPLQFFPKNKFSNLFQTMLVSHNRSTNGLPKKHRTQKPERKNISKIALLSEIKLFQQSYSHPEPILDQNALLLTPNQNSITLLPSFFAGIALTGNELRGEKPSIISNQKAMLSYRSGIRVEAIFNHHWSLETGIQYAVHRTQTDYQLEVPYTQNSEFQHDDGNFDNHYNHSLPSTMGDYPALLTLTRESQANVDEEEIMPLDLTIEQQLRFISVPLRLRYGFGKAPFRFGIKGGIVANRTFDISSKSVGLVSHHSAIHQRHTSVGNPVLNDLQQMTFDYSIGFDARLSISKRLQGFMEISHQRGLAPIYEEEGFQNFLRSDALLMGVIYTF